MKQIFEGVLLLFSMGSYGKSIELLLCELLLSNLQLVYFNCMTWKSSYFSPRETKILQNLFFWSSEKRLSFIQEASDRLELYSQEK